MNELLKRLCFLARAELAAEDLLDVKAELGARRAALGAGGMTRAEALQMLAEIEGAVDARVTSLREGNNTNRVRQRP